MTWQDIINLLESKIAMPLYPPTEPPEVVRVFAFDWWSEYPPKVWLDMFPGTRRIEFMGWNDEVVGMIEAV